MSVTAEDETLGADGTGAGADGGEERPDPGRPYRIAAWLVIVGSLTLAGIFVAVPAHAYDLDFRGRVLPRTERLDLVELWRIQTDNLPEIGQEGLFRALFVGCAVLFLLGSAYLVWLATVEIRPATDRAPAAVGSPDPDGRG